MKDDFFLLMFFIVIILNFTMFIVNQFILKKCLPLIQ